MQRGAAFFVGEISMRYLLPPAALAGTALLLAACNAADHQSAPGGVSQGEATALNDAAAMLDENAMMANSPVPEPEDRP